MRRFKNPRKSGITTKDPKSDFESIGDVNIETCDFVTIKFKGDCDFDIIKKLLMIPDSKIIHLYQNKNEVTWIRLLP